MLRYFYGPSSIFQISSPNMFQLNLLLRPISQMPCPLAPPPSRHPTSRFGSNPVPSSNKIVVSTKILRVVLLLGSKCLRAWLRAPISRPWSVECLRWRTCSIDVDVFSVRRPCLSVRGVSSRDLARYYLSITHALLVSVYC